MIGESLEQYAAVSIHGLAWSPTNTARSRRVIRACFNPRARVEPDADRAILCRCLVLFQSTGSRGARQTRTAPRRSDMTFQSTGSRGARRKPHLLTRVPAAVSIHVLAWSPTEGTGEKEGTGEFQSTGSRGARQSALRILTIFACFNPRARVEPDSKRTFLRQKPSVSIHGLAWSPTGERLLARARSEVSIHGLAWSPTGFTSNSRR